MEMQVRPNDAISVPANEWTIEPRAHKWSARLREVWLYRRLFVFFGKRSIERRYRNTLLGGFWLFRPVFPIIVRAFVFGGVLGVEAPGVPYFLFVLVGSSIWDFFSGCLMWSTRSLQINRSFLGRMYFPRVIVPAATMALAFVNFLIMMGIMIAVLGYYWFTQGTLYLAGPLQLLWALGALVLAAIVGLGVGLWACPMAATYRDVRYTLNYILEFWALLTPIMYPLSVISAKYHWIVFLNPLAGIVQAFKWGVLGIEAVNPTVFAIDAVLAVLVLCSGLWFFSRVEAQTVDRI